MSPLDIEGDFPRPVSSLARIAGTSRLVHLAEARRSGQAELLVEILQIAGDGGVVEGIDDRDRLPSAVARHNSLEALVSLIEQDLIEPVGVPDLGRRVAVRTVRAGAHRRQGKFRLGEAITQN